MPEAYPRTTTTVATSTPATISSRRSAGHDALGRKGMVTPVVSHITCDAKEWTFSKIPFSYAAVNRPCGIALSAPLFRVRTEQTG